MTNDAMRRFSVGATDRMWRIGSRVRRRTRHRDRKLVYTMADTVPDTDHISDSVRVVIEVPR